MRTIVSFIILVLVVFVTLPFKSNAATNFKPENQLLRPDIVFGKDREILHASIDLKWLFGMVLDKKTWITLCAYAVEKMKRVNSDHNNKVTYREEATNELLGLRSYNEKTPLRVFRNSLQVAHSLSAEKKRFVVYYIEDGEQDKVTYDTSNFRQALADSDIGNLLNEQFLFMASCATHPYAQKILENVSKDKIKSMAESMKFRRFEGEQLNNDLQPLTTKLPMLVVLAPALPVVPSTGSSSPLLRNLPLFKKVPEFDVIAVVSLKGRDITAQNVMRFLSGVIQNFGGRFVDDGPDTALFSMHAEPGV